MGINIDYLMESSFDNNHDYYLEVEEQLREASTSRSYESLQQIINTEINNYVFQKGYKRKLLLWHQGIVDFFYYKNLNKALHTLDVALNLEGKNTKAYKMNLEIMICKGNIYVDTGDYKTAINIYEEVSDILLLQENYTDIYLHIRLLYNLARTHMLLNQYELSIQYCEKAIKMCHKNYIFYALGDCYIILGLNLQKSEKIAEAKDEFNNGLIAYKLQKNISGIHQTTLKLSELESYLPN
ncbi:tetratricopeptide repeat protein [Pseudalkalibacillus hwajinpoensis]|uniref:Tetratricopeptide repeat protein n=1 Tax=Guptibacillus hwajinpoensis TaxID=208199 RepID=A0A4U1MFS3_9BACL|nr:tetratricopeptide repeat protein [Pseudalkalibacillus hwajinpoensis]